MQGYLDEKDDLDREVEEKAERRQRAKERKKMGLKPEEEDNKQAEKTFNWHFVHISVFFDNDSRQLILTHDGKNVLPITHLSSYIVVSVANV